MYADQKRIKVGMPMYDVTKVSFVNGRNVSKPLKMVTIAVAMIANHEPSGWNGALYGSVSREIPLYFNAFKNRLEIKLMVSC